VDLHELSAAGPGYDARHETGDGGAGSNEAPKRERETTGRERNEGARRVKTPPDRMAVSTRSQSTDVLKRGVLTLPSLGGARKQCIRQSKYHATNPVARLITIQPNYCTINDCMPKVESYTTALHLPTALIRKLSLTPDKPNKQLQPMST
jgi:hypothetical protein